MKRSGFKIKSRKPMKRGRLRVKGHSEASEDKAEIQALLREIGIIRDGGCVFRNYPEMGECGGRRNDGELILQFDHLNSRTHAVSFSDPRLGVIACLRHHLYFKRQYPSAYEECALDAIGPTRAKLLKRVREDRIAHKVDLKLEKIALEQELKRLQKQNA